MCFTGFPNFTKFRYFHETSSSGGPWGDPPLWRSPLPGVGGGYYPESRPSGPGTAALESGCSDGAAGVGCIDACVEAGCTDACGDAGRAGGCVGVGRVGASGVRAFRTALALVVRRACADVGCMDACMDAGCVDVGCAGGAGWFLIRSRTDVGRAGARDRAGWVDTVRRCRMPWCSQRCCAQG